MRGPLNAQWPQAALAAAPEAREKDDGYNLITWLSQAYSELRVSQQKTTQTLQFKYCLLWTGKKNTINKTGWLMLSITGLTLKTKQITQ